MEGLFARFKLGSNWTTNQSSQTATSSVIRVNVNNSIQQVHHVETSKLGPQRRKPESDDCEDDEKEDPLLLFTTNLDTLTKWKTHAEITMRSQQKENDELTLVNEKQRKTILGLQLDNESISNKLQEEIKKREETTQMILNTRTLIDAIKNGCEFSGNRINKLEEHFAQLTEELQYYAKEFEELKNKFISLNVVHEDTCNNLKNEFAVECQRHEEAEDNFRVESDHYERELTKHKVELDESAAQINKLNETIQGLQEQIDNVKKEKVAMGNDHSLKLEEVTKSIEQLKIINEELTTVKEEQIKAVEVLRENNLKELDKVNDQLKAEKEQVLKLEYKCKEKDNLLSENEARFSVLANHISELESTVEVKDAKIASLGDQQVHFETEIATFHEIKADLESVIIKMKDSGNEKQCQLEANKLEINECRGTLAYVQEIKEGLEKEVSKLTTELENLTHSCDYFENEYKGLKFSIEMQEKSYTNTIGKLKEKINSLELEKDLLEKKLGDGVTYKQQANLFSLELEGLKETTTKLEDEIASLKNTVQEKNNEIEDLKKTVEDARKSRKQPETQNSTTPLNNEKKTGASGQLPPIRLSNRKSTLKSCSKALAVSVAPIVPKTRSKPKSNTAVKPALPLFTPSDDTDSDISTLTARKRVSFSPIISTHILLEDLIPTPPTAAKKQCLRSQDKMSSFKKNATCYGKSRETLPKSTFGTRNKIGEENSDDLRWTDDVFKFNGD